MFHPGGYRELVGTGSSRGGILSGGYRKLETQEGVHCLEEGDMALSKPRRGGWEELSMSTAVRQVIQGGESEKNAARQCGVPRQTLRRHLAVVRMGRKVTKCLGRKPVLNKAEEKELVEVLLDMEKRLFGVSISSLRSYVFQYCEINARENNVRLLSLPSHCTHRLQPLDVAVFKSINSFYDQAVSTWLSQHPGRIVTEKEIPELFAIAYGKGATIRNAQSGFKKTGIHPFNPHAFSEEDFIAAELTANPECNNNTTLHTDISFGSSLASPSLEDSNEMDSHLVSPPKPGPSTETGSFSPKSGTPAQKGSSSPTSGTYTQAGSTSQCSPKFRDLIPIPDKGTRKPSTRRVAHSVILTDSLHKNSVENAKKHPPAIGGYEWVQILARWAEGGFSQITFHSTEKNIVNSPFLTHSTLAMGQAFELQSGEITDSKFNGKEYLDTIAAMALLKCSPINVSAPGYEDDIESDDTVFDLLVSSGSVKSIEDVKRAGSVDIGSVDKDGIILGSLHITGIVYFSSHAPVYEKDTKIFVWNCALHSASDVVFDCCAHAPFRPPYARLSQVALERQLQSLHCSYATEPWCLLTNNYTLTEKEAGTVIAEGTMDSKISETEASIFIVLEGHDHKYQAKLGELEVTDNGDISNVEVSDDELGDSEVKLIANSFKSHYTAEEVTGLISVRIVVYKLQDMNHTSLLNEMTSPITLIKSEDICRPELTPLQPLDPHSICSLIPQSMTVAWDDDYYAPHDKTTSQHTVVGAGGTRFCVCLVLVLRTLDRESRMPIGDANSAAVGNWTALACSSLLYYNLNYHFLGLFVTSSPTSLFPPLPFSLNTLLRSVHPHVPSLLPSPPPHFIGIFSFVEEDSSQNGWGSTPSPRYSSNHGADADRVRCVGVSSVPCGYVQKAWCSPREMGLSMLEITVSITLLVGLRICRLDSRHNEGFFNVLSENSCSTSTIISTPVKHTDSLPEWDDSVCPVRFIQREHPGWSSQAEKDPSEPTQARKDHSYSPHFLDRPEQEYIILAGDELRCEVRRDGKSKGDDWLILEKISQQKSYFVEQSSILIGERSSDFIIRNSCFEPSSDFGADAAAFVEDRPYKCNVCSSSFKKKQYLKVHSIIHTGERPFQCPHCDKSFRQKTHLNNHVSIHTGIKPFKCRLCELSFRQKQHLKKHESSSHNLEM
uniref:C2H2-type domain-containing protein n=1 Tax=Timema shepardi TaxID=629360 RepID=A0A7R9FZY6_TIMSH|nr:unnamed protein product [Timema shepardi]